MTAAARPSLPVAVLAAGAAHRWFLGTAAVCVAVFGWMLTYGSFRFVADDTFANFYDHQAAAWLKGRWDVPEPALSGEAFIHDGKVYGYFGPTPALQRLPLVVFGLGFGRVTRLFMLLDYIVLLAGAYALLGLAHRWRGAVGPPPPGVVVLFLASVGLGSMAFFLGSRAYVYHEAILCGLACAVAATYAALRYWETPASRWWLVALVAGVLAVHARPPIGLFALSVLGVAALGRLRLAPRRHLGVAVAAGLGVLSFNGLSYLKFRTFEGCPLHLNVQYTPQSLAVLENKNFHLANLRFNSAAYLLRPSFAVDGTFPYVYRTFLDRLRDYPESRLAYRDQTLAMPWAMPGLFALAAVGALLAAAFVPAHRAPLVVLALAAAPAALAMLTAVAVTQRYEADFCPFLFAVAAFGAAALPAAGPRLRPLVAVALAVFAVVGVLVVFALTIHQQREIVWGVPEDLRAAYRNFRLPASAAPR